jgi:hypothetical protein
VTVRTREAEPEKVVFRGALVKARHRQKHASPGPASERVWRARYLRVLRLLKARRG